MLDGFIVPRADEHQGEYVPAHSERLMWLTGFSGSAGAAIVLANQAVLFVDGRYTLQVRDQTDPEIFSYESLVDNPPAKWLKDNLRAGTRLAYDPWLHTIGEIKTLTEAAEKAGVKLVALSTNMKRCSGSIPPARTRSSSSAPIDTSSPRCRSPCG